MVSTLPLCRGGRPAKSVIRPPASSTIGTSAAKSQIASDGSMQISEAPRATSRCPQKSPKPRSRFGSGQQLQRGRALGAAEQRVELRVEELRVGQARDVADADPLPVHRGALALGRGIALAERRRARHTDHERAVDLQRDQRRPHRDRAGVVGGAVDRVDDPHAAGAVERAALFLAHDAVAGERRSDVGADHPFDRGVGRGHQGAVGLVPDLEALVGEQVHRDRRRLVGERLRERQLVLVHGRQPTCASGLRVSRPCSVISGSLGATHADHR